MITVTSVLTLATFAVDYGWYTFFLTPTFVLMSLPQLRDWHYAGLRIGTTMMGALVAMAAMWLLWPEREGLELGRLLGTRGGGGCGLCESDAAVLADTGGTACGGGPGADGSGTATVRTGHQ